MFAALCILFFKMLQHQNTIQRFITGLQAKLQTLPLSVAQNATKLNQNKEKKNMLNKRSANLSQPKTIQTAIKIIFHS